MKNTDRIATLIVDKVIDSIKSQFGDRVSAATFDAVRSGAIRTASDIIPFPLRFAINAIPKSTFETAIEKTEETVTRFVDERIRTIDPGTLSATTGVSAIVIEMVKTAMSQGIETIKGFLPKIVK